MQLTKQYHTIFAIISENIPELYNTN